MPIVKFTTALSRFFPGLQDSYFEGDQLENIIDNVDHQHPGIKGYILDEHGRLRKHVNVFIDGKLMQEESGLIGRDSEIFIIQALSGG